MSTLERRFAGLRPDRGQVLLAAVVLNTELLVVLAYVALARPRFGDLSPWTVAAFYAYPFVWLNVAALGVLKARVPDAPARRRLAAGLVASGYLLVLAYAGGLVGPAGRETGVRLVLGALPPGWSPALIYGGTVLQVTLVPFKLVGYLVLAYLVYATVLDAAGSVLGGVFGLFSCVSCTLPVIAGILSGLVGGSTALVTAATGQSYALSTVVFAVTVALLVWRPDWESVQRLRQVL